MKTRETCAQLYRMLHAARRGHPPDRFPKAHGLILTAFYLPVALILVGLMLRGVAFDFRVKARDHHKPLWNRAFLAGSALAWLAQGGRYITGFAEGRVFTACAGGIALLLPAAYVLLGAAWLI